MLQYGPIINHKLDSKSANIATKTISGQIWIYYIIISINIWIASLIPLILLKHVLNILILKEEIVYFTILHNLLIRMLWTQIMKFIKTKSTHSWNINYIWHNIYNIILLMVVNSFLILLSENNCLRRLLTYIEDYLLLLVKIEIYILEETDYKKLLTFLLLLMIMIGKKQDIHSLLLKLMIRI